MNRLLAIVPQDDRIDWPLIERTVMSPYVESMRNTPHITSGFHEVGDVWTHTKRVCESLIADEHYWALAERQRQETFLAALFHYIGRPSTTKLVDGRYTARGCRQRTIQMVRAMLWKDYDMAGTPEKQIFRETICLLTAHHALPTAIEESPYAEPHAMWVAAEGELAKDFSWELQCLFTEAWIKALSPEGTREYLPFLNGCRKWLEKLGCYTHPYTFPDASTRFNYLDCLIDRPDVPMKNQPVVEAVIVCGLPGTGKDTFISRHFPDLPVLSVDDINENLDFNPEEKISEEAQSVVDQASALLRMHKPFVWNATNLSYWSRYRIQALCRENNVATRIIFLETPWEENLRRNASRNSPVQEGIIENSLLGISMPWLREAENVEWVCV